MPASAMALDTLWSDVEWEDDARERFDLPELNRAFHAAVPVLEFVGWEVTRVSRGEAETILPLNVHSTNQHITHQAALMLLAADYTGGTALSTLFNRVPVIGIHPMKTDFGAYMWGAKATIRWLRPSCADLRCVASIDAEHWSHIAQRFSSGLRVLETVQVLMFNGDDLVGDVEFTYWAKNSHALCHLEDLNSQPHILYDQKLKTSARLIAGLRAVEQRKAEGSRLFDDPLAEQIAQPRGLLLAQRFSEYMPQLQPMVAARTRHLDEQLATLEGEQFNIINIGCGFDTRPWRIDLRAHHVFELDLPVMLAARERELPADGHQAERLIRVPIDLRQHRVDDVLRGHTEFDPSRPVFVIWEGGTMYFSEVVLLDILRAIERLCTHQRSRCWFDFVSETVVADATGLPEVEAFIQGMRRMGEPFVFGFRNVASVLASCGLQVETVETADDYIGTDDPTYSYYGFCVARRAR